MADRVDILSQHVPIVDDEGRPTAEFMLQWSKQQRVLLTIPDVTTAAKLSALLDLIGGTEGDILRRGMTEWDTLAYSGNVNTFLNGNGAYTQIAEAGFTFTDNTTANATTGRHGLLPKLSGTATEYLDGSGAWSTPGGGGSAVTRFAWERASNGVPTLADWTLDTAGSGSAAQGTYTIDVASTGSNTTIYRQTLPSQQIDFIAKIDFWNEVENYPGIGIGLGNASSGRNIGLTLSHRSAGDGLLVERFTNGTYNAGIHTESVIHELKWIRMGCDGTTITVYASHNGTDWVTLATEALSSWVSSIDEALLRWNGATHKLVGSYIHLEIIDNS